MKLQPQDAFLTQARGVIHVGAHRGQERDLYAALHLNVAWIEAGEEPFDELGARIAGFARQRAFRYLITEENGRRYRFRIATNQGMSSSILPMKEHPRMFPGVACETSVELAGATLASFVTREQLDLDLYDALVLDTQGTELAILRGAAGVLDHFRYVKVEAADFESYEDCCRAAELTDYLQEAGFRERSRHVMWSTPGIGTYYEIVCERPGDEIASQLIRAHELRAGSKPEEAREECRAILRRDAGNPDTLYLLGLIAQDRGESAKAVDLLGRAIAVRPGSAVFHSSLARALRATGHFPSAAAAMEKSFDLDSGSLADFLWLGACYDLAGHSDRAFETYGCAVALGFPAANFAAAVGGSLFTRGDAEAALDCYSEAIESSPSLPEVSAFLMSLHYPSGIAPETIRDGHFYWAGVLEAPYIADRPAHPNDRTKERRLRVGYLSPDFCRHPVSIFFRALAPHHNAAEVEPFYYSSTWQEDAVTAEFRALAGERWRDIRGLDDSEAAALIRADRIDILVDLAGYFGANRIPLLAQKPAPVEITWLGYPDTTGLSAVDYRITDSLADPPGLTEHLHSEELIRLPDCFLCYVPPDYCPAPSPLPARSNGFVTFGSFNNFMKVSRDTADAWAAILSAVPGSRLVIKHAGSRDRAAQDRLRGLFASRGIAAGRVDVQPQKPSHRLHFTDYHAIDIGLDPFPYNGTTSSCESLAMGVPLVTLAGKTHVSRVGVTLLSQVGLSDWIAPSSAEYVRRAVSFATDLDLVEKIRAELRHRLANSALGDAPGFARRMEHAYRTAWSQWCETGERRQHRARPAKSAWNRGPSSIAAQIAGGMDRPGFPGDPADILDRAAGFSVEGRSIRGMNGQFVRASILLHMLTSFGFDAFVETGAFRGETAQLVLRETGVRVLTCEIQPEFAAIAERALQAFPDRAELTLGDSRAFLAGVLSDPRISQPMFYLDAHWWQDLPLQDELRLIFGRTSSFAIVIDDFRVPGDGGFGYDTYPQHPLAMESIATLVASRPDLGIWYPGYPSTVETGARRGMLLLATPDLDARIEGAIPASLLRRP